MHSIYDNFLNHLSTCGGCIFPSGTVKCKFRGTCATAETLAQKGLIQDSEGLRLYGSIDRSYGNLPSKHKSTYDASRADFKYSPEQ